MFQIVRSMCSCCSILEYSIPSFVCFQPCLQVSLICTLIFRWISSFIPVKGPWAVILKLVLCSNQMPSLPSFLPFSHHSSLKRLMRCPTIIIVKTFDLKLYSTSTWVFRIFSECSSNLLRTDVIRVEVHHTTSFQIQYPALFWFHHNLSALIFKSLFGSWRPQQPLAYVLCDRVLSTFFSFSQASKLLF